MAERTRAREGRGSFSVGYHSLHPDVSLNFQMNRWFGWVGEPEMLVEMRLAAQRIASYADWTREFLELATAAFQRGHLLRAAFYWRSAEFFMRPDDPDRAGARDRFLETIRSVYAPELVDRHAVPYAHQQRRGFLPAYRFKPAQPKSTIVFFGGFDSSIEELVEAFLSLHDAGYDVIAFEGPGQGGALAESSLPMTAQWQTAVTAVLDHFKVDKVTLVGLSLGGCLALRAAGEPRVERIVAFDVLTDFSEVVLRQTPPALRKLLGALLRVGAAGVVNLMVGRVAKRSPVVEWGIQQGMHVTGTPSPYEFLRRMREFCTTDISSSVTQHVLLLAGSEDHYVPLAQWHRQIALLTNARSVTARLFTRAESAQNHCQVGNYRLALETIVHWIGSMPSAAVTGLKPPPPTERNIKANWRTKMRKHLRATLTVAVTLAAVSTLSLSGCGYNTFQTTDEQVKAGWAEVINQYQRRADLNPNLVNTVKGEAGFEQDTLTKVIEARAKATSIQATPELINDPAAFQKFQQAQGELTGALSRLMVVSEQYPSLKANQGFRDLSAQLEGTENRIAVARNRYIKTVQDYNVTVRSFPSNLTAMVFGYKEKPTFTVENEKGIARPPAVGFDTAPAKPAGPASGAAK